MLLHDTLIAYFIPFSMYFYVLRRFSTLPVLQKLLHKLFVLLLKDKSEDKPRGTSYGHGINTKLL